MSRAGLRTAIIAAAVGSVFWAGLFVLVLRAVG